MMYTKYIGPKFHMGYRYSIWRDFIYDFWVNFKKMGVIRGGEYIYRNPIIGILLGFPVLLLLIILLLSNFEALAITETNVIFLKLILCGIFLFIIFSFRATRFLGQPERYLEFLIPIMVLLPSLMNLQFWNWVILVLSLAVILFELIIIKILSRKDKGGITRNDINKDLLATFSKTVSEENKVHILSNNTNIIKYLANDRYSVFNINVTTPFTCGLHFKDVYPQKYGEIPISPIRHFIKNADVNWFILDTTLLKKELIENDTSLCLDKKAEVHNFIIYKLC
ncbi:MAG: hypothetical protein H0X63_05200 [Flavobacteriales bacterium]|nr:hypothetical protein [Flavobacteriales bacterium]